MLSLRFTPFDIDVGNFCKKGALASIFKKFLELVFITLRDDLDLKIRRVAHEARERQVPRVLGDEVTVENSLYFPLHNAPDFRNFHVPALYAWIWPSARCN